MICSGTHRILNDGANIYIFFKKQSSPDMKTGRIRQG